jgi:O-antigen/teichoic acid export membrane protein
MAEVGSSGSFIEKLKHWTGLDRAIAFTVLGRFWSAFVSLVTVLLIARYLSPSQQGYYYTFFSLVALQIVFELGFSFVVLQLAAHERSHLTFLPGGEITGSAVAHSRLASVLQKAVRWYSVAAALMALIVLPAGLYFFSTHHKGGTEIAWKAPWCLLVVSTILTFQIDPVFSFLEGCGFIAQVAKLRLVQRMLGAVLAWTAMLTHHGLFSPAMMILGQAAAGIIFLFTSPRRHFLSGLLRFRVQEHFVSWRREIWPFQWRIALSWLCGYFIFQICTPILFAYQGPVTAGQMGMSLTISSGIGSIAIAWMSTKAPVYGNLIARSEFSQLDRVFFAAFRQSTALVALGSAMCMLVLLSAGTRFPYLSARVLAPRFFIFLLLTTIMNHVVFCEAIYLRAHKREPFLVVTVIGSIFTIIATLLLARFGAGAIAVGYFGLTIFFGLPAGTYVFITKRREWHDKSRYIPDAMDLNYRP